MSVVFAGEDSEEDSEGVGQEEMEILTQLNNDDNKLVGKDQDVSNEKNGENVKSALDILHPSLSATIMFIYNFRICT